MMASAPENVPKAHPVRTLLYVPGVPILLHHAILLLKLFMGGRCEFCVRTPLPEKINGPNCRYFFKCKLETTFHGKWCTPAPLLKRNYGDEPGPSFRVN